MVSKIEWDRIRAVVFDVDGTLYNQTKVRVQMAKELFTYYMKNPGRKKELRILYEFRKQREGMIRKVNVNLEETQYRIVAERMKVTYDEVYHIVVRWMYNEPLRYVYRYKYGWVDYVIQKLYEKSIKMAFYSDYPLKEKLEVLNIECDNVFCSTDRVIDELKPSLKGLMVIAEKLELESAGILIIGDRDDRDGEGARMAHMPYIIFPKYKIKEAIMKGVLSHFAERF